MRWRPPQERLLEKVLKDPRTGCWLWTASSNKDGYGWFKHRGSMRGAHKCSYEILVGDIPDGQCVRHTCDNPRCVNPAHLVLGTQGDNVRDMHERGRARKARGSAAGSARLSEVQVSEIKRLRLTGATQVELASQFGVAQTTISRLDIGKTWRHVDACTP